MEETRRKKTEYWQAWLVSVVCSILFCVLTFFVAVNKRNDAEDPMVKDVKKVIAPTFFYTSNWGQHYYQEATRWLELYEPSELFSFLRQDLPSGAFYREHDLVFPLQKLPKSSLSELSFPAFDYYVETIAYPIQYHEGYASSLASQWREEKEEKQTGHGNCWTDESGRVFLFLPVPSEEEVAEILEENGEKPNRKAVLEIEFREGRFPRCYLAYRHGAYQSCGNRELDMLLVRKLNEFLRHGGIFEENLYAEKMFRYLSGDCRVVTLCFDFGYYVSVSHNEGIR